MKMVIAMVLLTMLSTTSGSKVLYRELDQAEFDHRVQDRFYLGMTHGQTSSKIKGMGLKPQVDRNDIVTYVLPQRLPIITSSNELYFNFGDDNALDIVHYFATGTSVWNDDLPHIIKLPAEATP